MFSAEFNVSGSSSNNNYYYGNTNNNIGFSMGMGMGATASTTTTTYGTTNNNGGASVSVGFGAPAVGISVSTVFETPDKQGNLRKFAVGRSYGGAKNWKERYFATNGATLSYAFMIGSEPMRAPCQLCGRSQLITAPTPNNHPAATSPELMFLLVFYEEGIERKLLMEAPNPVAKAEWVACLAARVGWVDGQRAKRFVVVAEPPVVEKVVVWSPNMVVASNNNVSVEVNASDAMAAAMMAAGAATVATAGMVGAATMGGAGGSVSFEANAGGGATCYGTTNATTTSTYYSSSSTTTNVDGTVTTSETVVSSGGGPVMSCDVTVNAGI